MTDKPFGRWALGNHESPRLLLSYLKPTRRMRGLRQVLNRLAEIARDR